MSTAKLLFRGAGLRTFAMLVSIASSFFLAPFVIHSLGDRWYGLWILVGSFVGFYDMLDLGLSGATQRYLAYALPRNDPEEMNTIIASSLVMLLIIALAAFLITVGVAALAPFFISNLHDITVFRELTFIMGSGFAISVPFFTQYGIINANLRFDYSSYISLGKIVLRTGLFFLVLGVGYGIIPLALTSVGVDILSYIALVLIARSLAPWLKLRARHFNRSQMRKLFNFGFFVFIGKLSSTIKFRMDNVVLAGALNLESVTHFNIATKLNGYSFNIIRRMVPSPGVLYTRYYARGEIYQMRDKFLILARINVILGMLAIGAVLIFARPFITLWVGPKYVDAFIPLVIIMTARIPGLTQNAGNGIAGAMAKQKFVAFVNLAEAITNLILSIVLVHFYGIVGVALGTAIPLAITRSTVFPAYICRIVEMPISRLAKNVLPLYAAAALVHLPLLYLTTMVDIDTYWQIVAYAGAYYLPVIAFFYLVMLKPAERALFVEALPWTPNVGQSKHVLRGKRQT